MSSPTRDTSLTQVISSDVSDASANPYETDDLDADGRISRGCSRLRALSGSGWWFSPLGRIKIAANKGLGLLVILFVITYNPV